MSTQMALDTIHNIPKTKTDLPYIEAWRSRYSDLEPVFVDSVKPINCALGHICLAHIRRHPEVHRGRTGAIIFSLFLMPFNPTSKIDRELINCVESYQGKRVLPWGDLYAIWSGKGKRPGIKTSLGILSFLSHELNGRLLSDKERTRWAVVVL